MSDIDVYIFFLFSTTSVINMMLLNREKSLIFLGHAQPLLMNSANFVAFINELKGENMFKGMLWFIRNNLIFTSRQEKHWKHGVPRPNEQDDQVVWMGFFSFSFREISFSEASIFHSMASVKREPLP